MFEIVNLKKEKNIPDINCLGFIISIDVLCLKIYPLVSNIVIAKHNFIITANFVNKN